MSVFIQITDDLAIESDDRQWKVSKRKWKSVKDDAGVKSRVSVFEGFKFYPTLEMAVQGLGRYMLQTSGAQSIDELVKAAGEISMLLSQKFTASAEVRIK